MNPAPFPFWLDLAFRALPPILVVGGWIVVYQLQALQARRKLIREESDKARAAIVALQQAAVEFHTNAFSVSRRLGVLSMLTDVDRRRQLLPTLAQPKRVAGVFRLSPVSVPADIVIDAKFVVEMRQAITLNHFDDPVALPLEDGSQQLELIAQRCVDLVAAIDRVLVAALD